MFALVYTSHDATSKHTNSQRTPKLTTSRTTPDEAIASLDTQSCVMQVQCKLVDCALAKPSWTHVARAQ